VLGKVRQLLRWLGNASPLVLAAVLVVVVASWAFIRIADEVHEGETQHFDDWAIRALRRPNDPAELRGPKWMHEVARDITALGGVTVLLLVTAAVVGYLIIDEKQRGVWLVLTATLGGLGLSTLLKDFFARPRPSGVPHLSSVYTSSFPSGHSMLSAVVYLTLGSLLARLVPQRALKFYFVFVALVLTFLIGVSRVYMGVHYPTDVLAGWAAGLVWALLCWLVARYLQRRGAVEKDTEHTHSS
jgi:undecaprenyl-diphosphatase